MVFNMFYWRYLEHQTAAYLFKAPNIALAYLIHVAQIGSKTALLFVFKNRTFEYHKNVVENILNKVYICFILHCNIVWELFQLFCKYGKCSQAIV